MTRLRLAALLFASAFITGAGLAAQQSEGEVHVTVAGGRTWISARQATLAQILAEYSRVAGVRIETASPLPPQATSVDLASVSERQAFDVLLRGIGGFVAVPRRAADGRVGLSEFARVVIVSTSHPADNGRAVSAPRPAVSAPSPSLPQAAYPVAPGVNRLLGPDGQPVPDDQADAPIVQPLPVPAPAAQKRPGGRD